MAAVDIGEPNGFPATSCLDAPVTASMLACVARSFQRLPAGTGLLLLFSSFLRLQAGPHVELHAASPLSHRVQTFDRSEWIVEVDQGYTNPFAPEEVTVEVQFRGPQGEVLKVPAFWCQNYQKTNDATGALVVAVGPPHWRVRFAPPQPGQWKALAEVRDASGAHFSHPEAFIVKRGTSPGFVRRSAANRRYLQFDSGASFFMIGPNIGWGTLDEYRALFDRLQKVRVNFVRIWISPPNPVLETREAGLGRYDLGAAWFYDQLLEMAEARGIYVMLTLKNYRDLVASDYWGEAPWPMLPYNAAQGGPAAQPGDFFTGATARQLYQRHLQYLIGRYSAFTSLAFWELWNEQDNMNVGSIAPWTREMAAYLKAHDPVRHLVTTSYGGLGEPDVWHCPDIDLTQRHFYGEEGSVRDAVPVVSADARLHDCYQKPHFMGELGISWRQSDDVFDPHHTAANVHDGLWASALSGNAGGASVWFWYDYLRPRDLWWPFLPLARFAAPINWAQSDFQPIPVDSPTFDKIPKAARNRDCVFSAAGSWGKADPTPIQVRRDGTATGCLPTFLYGPIKPDLRAKLVLEMNLAKATTMTVRVNRASSPCTMQIDIDDRRAAQAGFQPLPEPESHRVGARSDAAFRFYSIAESNRNVQVAVPAGAHSIALDVVQGDWVALETITLANALSPEITGLQPLALADRAGGEIIAWLHDPNSNWHSDLHKIQPALFDNISFSLPTSRPGQYRVEWWDTYKGEILRTDNVRSDAGHLRLQPPSFERDIALRAMRRE